MAAPKYKKPIAWRYVAEAAGLFALGMLTHQLPSRAQAGRWLLPTDWKVFFRIAMGIFAVNRLNKGLNWQPSPMANAVETVAVINPLALGFSKLSLGQFAVMAPLIAGMVGVMTTINQKYGDTIQEKLHIPPLVTRLAMSVGFGVLGYKLFPKILNRIFKNVATAGAATATGAAFVTTCARGCSPSLICMSEVAELGGSLMNWLRGHKPKSIHSQSKDNSHASVENPIRQPQPVRLSARYA